MNAPAGPTFTVIIPVFGEPDTLKRALHSCMAQTFTDFEVIVVDDHSPTPLAPAVAGLADRRFITTRNSMNLGASASRNVGMGLATGRYVAFIDADDIMLPSRLEHIARCLDVTPDLVLHRQYRVFNADPTLFAYEVMPRTSMSNGDDLAAFAFRNGDFYNMNSFAVRRDLLHSASFDLGLRLYEDQAFIFNCYAASRRTIVLDEALSVYVDDERAGRASRRYRDPADLTAFLDYARHAVSPRAFSYIEAAVRSERGDGVSTLIPAVLRAWRQGLPVNRALFYLLRSVLGQGLATKLRATARRSDGTQSLPEWAGSLLP